ncbi:MAG TPA: M12 family metallo-peptidase [Thermoanaerobaculia bacterium]|nr:M12 family metallo-peptidase [Thermoanaerobaculia bacterium]
MSFLRALVAAGLLFALPLTASETLWRDVAADAAPQSAERQRFPTAYRLLFLDTAAFRNFAQSAPREGTDAAAPTLALPMPDGSFSRFALHESAIVDAALAARLPEVKTWRVQGIDEPAATGRLDWTPAGFHAFILSPAGNVYIDPYAKGGTDYYISYWRRDYPRAAGVEPFRCELGEEAVPVRNVATHGAVTPATASGPVLRTYRLAVAATGEYTLYYGGTVAGAQAGIVTTFNRINAIYETEVGVRLVLVDNTSIVFPHAGLDPYTNTSSDLAMNQSKIDEIIGSANYDIGHLLGTGGGGIASLGVVCLPGWKARGLTGAMFPQGDAFDVDYVAHEVGHQFGASHTFNGTTSACGGNRRVGPAAYEPGSGSTIMAYAGICTTENLQPHSDPYFHAKSLEEILYYFTLTSCPVETSTGNSAPLVTAGPPVTIPMSTPFYLTGSATDPNGDSLTYNWEQYDLGLAGPPNTDDGFRPIFRSFNATASPTRTFPQLSDLLGNTTTFGESLPTTMRTMNYRLTVRDNRAGGGGVDYGTRQVHVTDTAGPFVVTAPNTAVNWMGGSTQIVTWNAAGTTAAPVSCANVKIQLSTDGGNTFPTTLLASTPNDGTQVVAVPSTSTSAARIRVECATSPFFDLSDAGFTITPAVNVTAIATTPTNVFVTWPAVPGADSYDVYRRAAGGTFVKIGSTATTSYNDPATANTAYLYAMKSIDGSVESALSNPDLATTVIFTDPTLTRIKAVHITQLRTAVNAVRTLAALGAGTFTDPTVTAGTTRCKAAHITDLRTALAAARTALFLSAPNVTDPTLTAGDTKMKGVHVTELRDGVK